MILHVSLDYSWAPISSVFDFVSDFILFYFSSQVFCVPSWRPCAFAGYFIDRFLLSAVPAFFSELVPGSIWFDFVYLVTTAGFVADQLM